VTALGFAALSQDGWVASFNLWSRQNVCCLAKETSRDPKGATGTRAFELRARRMRVILPTLTDHLPMLRWLRIRVFGYSMGGGIALELAMHHSELVGKLV
jgi:pimeloyl-ACP methyl ester carboxylesterase